MDENDIILNKNDFKAFIYDYLQEMKANDTFEYGAEKVLAFTEKMEFYYWGRE